MPCRFLIALFAAVAFAAAALAAEPAFTPKQKRAVEDVVRQYLRDNPEVLIEAIEALREKQRAGSARRLQETLASKRGELENDPASPVAGNPEGNVTVVEFFDYNCPYCKMVYPRVRNLLESDGNIRYVLKEFPILGPQSVAAARAALAIWKMDSKKYMPFHASMMKSRGKLSEATIFDLAAEAGFDAAALRKAMAEPWIDEALQKNIELAESLDINGTPGFVIGNRVIPGAVDLDTLKELVAAARKGGARVEIAPLQRTGKSENR